MREDKHIAWQKFEDVIKNQVDSELISDVFKIVRNQQEVFNRVEADSEEPTYFDREEHPEDFGDSGAPSIQLSDALMNDISTASSFNCWIGHTDFSITPSIARKIEEVPGVEALRVHTRYRFLVGIGEMFDFQKVRQDIEKLKKD
jgi:hypothetical protein